jgi:adenylate cyclase
MGCVLTYTGRREQAMPHYQRGLELNPLPPIWYDGQIGVAEYLEGRYERSAASFRHAPKDEWVWDLMYLAASLGQLGRAAEARAALDECARLKPDLPVIKFAKAEPYLNPADTEHLIDGLRKAGLDV